MSMSALRPSGNEPTTPVRLRISRLNRSVMLLVRIRRPRSRTQPDRQRSHHHRCLPAPVNPFLRIRSPHNGQRIAPDDLLLLMEQANQQCQAPAEDSRHDQQCPATRKTPVSLTRN